MIRRLLVLCAVVCMGAARGSLDGMADALVERALPSLGPRLDVAVAVEAPSPRLAADLGGLVVARLRERGAAAIEASPTGWSARGFERLVRVMVTVEGARLRAAGEVLAVESATWAPEPLSRGKLFVEAPLDGELRAYLPPAAAREWQARAFSIGDIEILAIDAGDLDGDGRAEVAAATAGEVVVWSFGGSGFVEKWRQRFEGRPPSSRPRADLATVAVLDGAVRARASGFESGIRRRGGTVESERGFPLPGLGGACALEAGVDFLVGCGVGELPERVWAAVAHRDTRAAIEPPSTAGGGGTLWLLQRGAPPSRVAGVGAQVAVGAVERGEVVVTSEPVFAAADDAIVVRQAVAGAPILHRAERLNGLVRGLAVADLDGDGRAEVVGAVRDVAGRRTELWVIR